VGLDPPEGRADLAIVAVFVIALISHVARATRAARARRPRRVSVAVAILVVVVWRAAAACAVDAARAAKQYESGGHPSDDGPFTIEPPNVGRRVRQDLKGAESTIDWACALAVEAAKWPAHTSIPPLHFGITAIGTRVGDEILHALVHLVHTVGVSHPYKRY